MTWNTETTACGWRVNHAIDEVEAPIARERVREVDGWHALFTVHDAQTAQFSIAGRDVDGPCLLVDHRRGVLRTRATVVWYDVFTGQEIFGSSAVRERFLPADGAGRCVDRVHGVVAADDEDASRRTLRQIYCRHQRRRQCGENDFSRRGWNHRLPFQRELPNIGFVDDGLAAIPQRTFLVVAPRQPLAGGSG